MKDQCDNCGWKGKPKINAFADIPNLFERLDPGGVVPSGECPECGALCYPIKPKPKKKYQAVHVSLPSCRGQGTGWEVKTKTRGRWLTVCDCWSLDDHNAKEVAEKISDLLNEHNPF